MSITATAGAICNQWPYQEHSKSFASWYVTLENFSKSIHQ